MNKNQLEASRRRVETFEINPEIGEVLQQRSLERAILPIDEPTLVDLEKQATTLWDLRLIPERVHVHDGTDSLLTRQNCSY